MMLESRYADWTTQSRFVCGVKTVVIPGVGVKVFASGAIRLATAPLGSRSSAAADVMCDGNESVLVPANATMPISRDGAGGDRGRVQVADREQLAVERRVRAQVVDVLARALARDACRTLRASRDVDDVDQRRVRHRRAGTDRGGPGHGERRRRQRRPVRRTRDRDVERCPARQRRGRATGARDQRERADERGEADNSPGPHPLPPVVPSS